MFSKQLQMCVCERERGVRMTRKEAKKGMVATQTVSERRKRLVSGLFINTGHPRFKNNGSGAEHLNPSGGC